MPFVRFGRDKRGYEHVYLVHVGRDSEGRSSQPRILYWYRTPPGVKVGREPFDAQMRRTLEAQYPNLTFDWTRIANASIPPADTENWRERRRLERAMKRSRSADDAAEVEPAGSDSDDASRTARRGEGEHSISSGPAVPEGVQGSAEQSPSTVTQAPQASPRGARKRRRRGRRGHGTLDPSGSSDAQNGSPDKPTGSPDKGE